MKRRVLCFIFSLLLLLTAFPFAASAAESYGIFIEGVEVTSENAADVLGDGTVSFSPEKSTLNLNGADLKGAEFDDYIAAISINRTEETVINVESESKIHINPGKDLDTAGVFSVNSVRFTGEMLEIVIYPCAIAIGVYSDKGGVIFDNNIIYIDAANATETGIGVYGNTRVRFENADVRIYGTTEPFVCPGATEFVGSSYFMGEIAADAEHGAYKYLVYIPPQPDDNDDDDNPPGDKDDLPPVEEEEKDIIDTDTDWKDVKGSRFLPLMLRAKAKKRTITLAWKKVKGADGYIIYGARCGSKMKRLKTIKNAGTLKRSFKKLKKGKYYKYIVVAYKNTDGTRKVLAKSKSVHCKTAGGKRGNPTGIKLKTTALTVKKGKSKTLHPVLLSNKKVAIHIAAFRYESSKPSVASVNKNGKITAKKKGTAYIYVITQNGLYKKVKITVN